MATLAQILLHATLRKVFLLELSAPRTVATWSGSGPWTTPAPFKVVGLVIDGTDLTAAPGWSWSLADRELELTTSLLVDGAALAEPRAHHVQVWVEFGFSSLHGIERAGITYRPLLLSAPELSERVGDRFEALAQVGGGEIVLDNAERLWDDLQGHDWDAGTARLYLGADYCPAGQWVTMDPADYTLLATWIVEAWEVRRETTTLRVRETTARAVLELPQERLVRADHPNMHKDAEGQGAPIIYGTVLQVPAYCTDLEIAEGEPGAGEVEFLVAGHPLVSLDGCTVGGASVAFTAVDLDAATFRLASWDPGADGPVRVNATGRRITGTTQPLTSPADVVQDLLEEWTGESRIDSASFSAARAQWLLGTRRSGREVHAYEVARWIGEPTPVLDLCTEIAAAAAASVTLNPLGNYGLTPWAPVPSAGVLKLRAADVWEVRAVTDTAPAITRAVSRYARRHGAEAARVVEEASATRQRERGYNAHRDRAEDVPFHLIRCARLWASRTLAMDGAPRRLWEVVASHRGFELRPGDAVRLDSERLSGYFEVLEVVRDLEQRRVRLRLSDWRGLGDGPGFVADAAATLPSHLGGGSAATWSDAWSDDQADHARKNYAYASDPYGYAAPTDARSHHATTVSA